MGFGSPRLGGGHVSHIRPSPRSLGSDFATWQSVFPNVLFLVFCFRELGIRFPTITRISSFGSKSDVFDSRRLHQTSAVIAAGSARGVPQHPLVQHDLAGPAHHCRLAAPPRRRTTSRLARPANPRRVAVDLPISNDAISNSKHQLQLDRNLISLQSGLCWSAGRLGRWRRPIQARALMYLATSSMGGLRSSVHQVPTKVTIPMRALA